MTGVAIMLAGDGPYSVAGGGGGPLSCAVTFTSGIGPINVSGASGLVPGIAQSTETGGTPPYTVTTYAIQNDASGKLILIEGSGGATQIAYSGFSLNETEGGYIRYAIRDSLGATASAIFPSTGVIAIKRAS